MTRLGFGKNQHGWKAGVAHYTQPKGEVGAERGSGVWEFTGDWNPTASASALISLHCVMITAYFTG